MNAGIAIIGGVYIRFHKRSHVLEAGRARMRASVHNAVHNQERFACSCRRKSPAIG